MNSNRTKKLAYQAKKRLVRNTLKESIITNDFWLAQYVDFLDRYVDVQSGYPINNPNDRKFGSNYPFWYSEQQLSMIRANARLLTTTNPNAAGLLNGLCSYVIGAGYNYRVTPKANANIDEKDVHDCQEAIGLFMEANYWEEYEEEIFKRSRSDGDCFVRKFFEPDGVMKIRTIEPEWIFQPPGSDFSEWSYGILTKRDDVYSIKKYHVNYAGPGGEDEKDGGTGDIVDAKKIQHIKVNVPFSIKRGMSDFSFETLDTFKTASKLRKNLGEGASVQSAIAAVRQHESADAAQVESFVDEMIDYSVINAPNSKQTDYQQIEPGTFLDIPKGMNYVAPPGASSAKDHLEIFQALLRSAGNRHNAPEWLSSANVAGANYASSLTAESPFLRNCVRMQRLYKRHFKEIVVSAVECAIEFGKVRPDILKLVDIVVTPPAVEARDKIADASANQTYFSMRVKSPQTISQEIGVNFEAEQRNFEQNDEMMANTPALGGPGGSSGEIADSALNGLQIQSLSEVVMSVATGKFPVEVGRAIAKAAFPLIDEENINAIFPDSLFKSVTPPEEVKANAGNAKPDQGNPKGKADKGAKAGGGLPDGKAGVKPPA